MRRAVTAGYLRERLTAGRAAVSDAAAALASRPLRLIWTLLISLAYIAAAHPLLAYDHAFWLHASTWFHANYQVDYGEGPLFNQEVMLLHGRSFYSLDQRPPFIVGNYPPVFPAVAALFMRFYGPTFTAGRLVSSLAIAGSAILVGLIVWQATGQAIAAWIAGGLLPTMPGIYSWGPFNRVDSLALFFSLLTVWVVLRYAGTRRVWWAVPCALLTVYTRQSMVDGIFAAYVYLLWRDWRRGLSVGLATAAGIFAAFVGLQVWTHGAFYVNAVVDNENAWNFGTVVGNWHGWMGGSGRFMVRLGLGGAALGLAGAGGLLWPVWLAASVAVFATIGKVGAAINYFFPLYAAAAACLGVLVGRVRRLTDRAPWPLWPLELLLPAMLFVFIHGQPPRWARHVPFAGQALARMGPFTLRQSPTAAGGRANDLGPHNPGNVAMAHALAAIHGPVLGLDFPWGVAVQAGHTMQWQPFELGTVHTDGHWNAAPFLRSIDGDYYAAVFFRNLGQVNGYLGGPLGTQVQSAVRAHYHFSRSVAGFQIWRPDLPGGVGHFTPARTAPAPRPLAQLGAFLTGGLWTSAWHALLSLHIPIGSGAPVAQSVGPYREISLYRQFNVAAIGSPGAAQQRGYDGGGNTFPPSLLPAPGSHTFHAGIWQVPFLLPRGGSDRRSALGLAAGARIALPAQRDRAVWLLESGVNGPQRVGVSLVYAGGQRVRRTVTFSDWCMPPTPPQVRVLTARYRLGPAGQRTSPACGLDALRLTANQRQVLSALDFAASPNARVVAITLQR